MLYQIYDNIKGGYVTVFRPEIPIRKRVDEIPVRSEPLFALLNQYLIPDLSKVVYGYSKCSLCGLNSIEAVKCTYKRRKRQRCKTRCKKCKQVKALSPKEPREHIHH